MRYLVASLFVVVATILVAQDPPKDAAKQAAAVPTQQELIKKLEADLTTNHLDSRFVRGDYRTIGVRLIKRFRLSRWMLAWISLGVSRRDWYGAPPAGEANSTTVSLTIGTTFR